MANGGKSLKKRTGSNPPAKDRKRKTRVFQSEIPRFTVREASRIPEALADNYAKAPTKPLHVAAALDMTANSSRFRMLVGASSAYGLTSGAWDSDAIALTGLGKRFVEASSEQAKRDALKEAFLKPRVIGEFLRKYSNARFPRANIAGGVLEELGVLCA